MLKVWHWERNKFTLNFTLIFWTTSQFFSRFLFLCWQFELFKKDLFGLTVLYLKKFVVWHISCFKMRGLKGIFICYLLWPFFLSLCHSLLSLKLKGTVFRLFLLIWMLGLEKSIFKDSLIQFPCLKLKFILLIFVLFIIDILLDCLFA